MTSSNDSSSDMAMPIDLNNWHWMLYILQTIDVGLVVVDRDYKVCVWNSFMENHSGIGAEVASGKTLFETFPDVQEDWLRHKIDSVFLLDNRAYTIWEERPYVFKFKNYRPITSTAEFMYQYTTLLPLKSTTGETSHVAMVIYDVTDIAVNRLALQEANNALEHMSITDQMTQLFNRGHWETRLQQEYCRFKRHKEPVSLVMFDIDHFKKINDTYGHQPGDEVIRQVAQIMRDTKRESDIAGRYGGEEFGVILIGSDGASANYFAERLRKRVEKTIVNTSNFDISFTISLGIAQLDDSVDDYTTWIKNADAALYASKHNGRNQSTLHKPGMPPSDEG